MKKLNTVIYPIIRDDLVERSLETLYKYTEKNFYVIVIDQTVNGLAQSIIDKYVHLHIRPYRNLGFAKAVNMGIRLVQTPFFTLCNDDVEFIDRRWWDGVLETFALVDRQSPEKPCVMVNPASAKLPDWSIGNPPGEHLCIIPYKAEFTPQDWDSLVGEAHYVNERLTIQPGSVIDGVVMYCSVFRKDYFDKVGPLDEMFYPGGGEDYDWSCRSNLAGFRSVGTTLSWVWHHWSSSLANQGDYPTLIDEDRRWNNNHEKWGEDFDVWGTDASPPNHIAAL
jgi:GT2 family glycosyltransferase